MRLMNPRLEELRCNDIISYTPTILENNINNDICND